jgi:hypothetical protein
MNARPDPKTFKTNFLLFEACVMQDNKVIRQGLHRRTLIKVAG